jgi:hypothetical protein
MQSIDDSFLLRNLQDREKTEENDKTTSEENIIKPKALRMEKNINNNNILKYNPNVNYYEEYWKMVCDNEYLMAQIKETMVEIESMKTHIQQLSNQ